MRKNIALVGLTLLTTWSVRAMIMREVEAAPLHSPTHDYRLRFNDGRDTEIVSIP